jgi:Ni,Fe-hydrogenase I small subunit
VIEGSIPDETNKQEGYWAGFGNDTKTGQPITTCEWIDRLAPKAGRMVAAGTCAAYGGIHAMESDQLHGIAGLPGTNVEIECGNSYRLRSWLSGAAGQHVANHVVSAYMAPRSCWLQTPRSI